MGYLVVQALIFIDLGYVWSQNWLDGEGNSGKLYSLFAFFVVFTGVYLAIICLCFYWFTDSALDCQTEIVLLVVTIVLILISNILSFAGCFDHACNT